MEVILSKLLGKGTEGFPDEAITKSDIRAVVKELKNSESDNQEADTSNREIAPTTDK